LAQKTKTPTANDGEQQKAQAILGLFPDFLAGNTKNLPLKQLF
jgi:hypothetical protein